jgi:hypothetical protein
MEKKAVLWITVFLVGTSFALSGCAALRQKKAADTEALLSSAGFVARQPVTVEDMTKLEKARPLTLTRGERNGKILYVYPDPYYCKCVYVGTEENYREYTRIAKERQIVSLNPDPDEAWKFGPPSGHDDVW